MSVGVAHVFGVGALDVAPESPPQDIHPGGSSALGVSPPPSPPPPELTEEEQYDAVCARVYGICAPRPARLFRVPFLGGEPAVIPEEAMPLLWQPSVVISSAHDRVVSALAQAASPLEYAPQVNTLVLILLQQLGWSEART